MAEPTDLATPMMRRRASFECDLTRRQRSEEAQNLVTRKLPVEDLLPHFVDGVNLEPALSDIQSDADDLTHDVGPFPIRVENRPLWPPSLNAQGGAVHIISSADRMLLHPRPIA